MRRSSFRLVSFAIVVTCSLSLALHGCRSGRTPPPQPGRAASVEKDLQVSRFSTSDLSNEEADHILGDASTVLKVSDGPDDIACDLTLSRSGDVSTFRTGNGIINTASDFRRVCEEPGFVHIVNQINWCNGSIPNVIGCAKTPGECMVVVRFLPDPELQQEGILWAHEYGHTRNLGHRDDSDAVMNSVIEASHRKVDQSEADVYLEGAQAATSRAGVPMPANVRDFVRRTFIHGVPFDQAQQFNNPEAIQALLSMLQDPAEEAYWPNVVVTLGMTGNAEVAQPLSAFVERGEGVMSPPVYRAKTSALMALGYVVGKTGRQEVVNYLVTKSSPQSWRRLNWTGPFAPDAEARNLQLSQSAIMALGLSGDSRARNALLNLERVNSSFRSGAATILSETSREALKENLEAQILGLDRYTLKGIRERW